MTEKEARKISESVFALAGRSPVEVMIMAGEEALTRFANNVIHQNVHQASASVTLRLMQGRRVGRASTNRFDKSSLKRCVEAARAMARVQRPDPELLPLPGPQKYQPVKTWVGATARLTPEDRACAVRDVIARAKSGRLIAAGIYSSGGANLALANSRGVWAWHRATEAAFSVTMAADNVSGWAERTDKDVSKINTAALADRAIGKALAGRRPKELPPGEYDVVLEPAAVAELLMFVSIFGFDALAYREGRSFASGKLGKKLFGDNLTLRDDAYAPGITGIPFDFEGMPRKPVTLVERGVLKGLVHDRKTAKKAGTRTTGHGLPQPSPHGPVPLNPVIETGDSSLDEMIRSTERGILVTHFHYTNIIDPMQMTLTGMTRDGTFLIESGEVGRAVKNMRFTESMLRAFNQVEAISREAAIAASFWGSTMVAPAMKIRGFRFSSGTEF